MSEAQDDDVQEFAALLRHLKERTDRSYGQLARRLNMNTSTLHRYCAGDAVPLDFAPVERFAALCGATPPERLELHHRWILAVAARQRPRTATEAAAPPTDDSAGEAAEEPPPPGPPRRPWYRRRRLLVSAAVATALLATLGSLSALPGDDRPRSSDSVEAADPPRTTAPGTGTPRPKSTGSPSPSPTTPSPSAGASKKSSATPTATAGGHSEEAGPQQSPAGLPLTWSADSHVWQAGCGHDYVIAKPPRQVPPPPAPQDAATWAATQNAVHGQQTMVEITVQGRTSTAVVLEALRVRVVGRSAPMAGTTYAMDNGCGGALTPRYFDVALDKDRPIARPVDGNDTGVTIPAMRLPYRVSAEDPEVLLVDARTQTCDCRWYLELDWSSQGRTGTLRIDDHGRPFRTSSIKGLPNYAYDTSARAWVPSRD
ncbi:helix-turn-helix domain-containing protein [Streptomyces sp. UG1]|uniref:helix-turn-helix domain-containing protein n=1 Tax=Streptomyces sp. UG1 TaxID=3417652 RepID=UPI003CEC2CED